MFSCWQFLEEANWSWKRCRILSRVTLKFDGWPCKTIGHLSYAAPSFAHHFIAICSFKLELQSENAQFGSKLTIFLVTLKFDGWPLKTIWHLFYTTSSFMNHFIAICEFKLELPYGNAQFGSKSAFFIPCDLQIWRMAFKNNKAPLVSNIKTTTTKTKPCSYFVDNIYLYWNYIPAISYTFCQYPTLCEDKAWATGSFRYFHGPVIWALDPGMNGLGSIPARSVTYV